MQPAPLTPHGSGSYVIYPQQYALTLVVQCVPDSAITLLQQLLAQILVQLGGRPPRATSAAPADAANPFLPAQAAGSEDTIPPAFLGPAGQYEVDIPWPDR